MWKLTRYLKGYWRESLIAPLFKMTEAIFELILPLVVAEIIDVGIPGGNSTYVWAMAGIMLGLGAVGLTITIISQYLAARASCGFGTNLRNDLYKHINKFSFTEMDSFGAPSLITRINNDITQAQTTVSMFIRLVLRAPFIVVGSVVMACLINWKLALIFLAAAIAIALVLWLIMSKSMPYYRKIQKKLDHISLLTRENLSGNRVVRAFSKQEEEQAQFEQSTDELAKIGVRVGKIAGLLSPLTYVIVNAAIIAIVWFGAKTVDMGTLEKGDIIALVNYMTQIFLALVVMANLAVLFTKSSACAARINEVLAVQPSMTDNTASRQVETLESVSAIAFKNVDFSYHIGDETPLLKNISFELRYGETMGIIGATGSGKSTLVNLIPRFYDITGGDILVDGLAVTSCSQADLRAKIGLVPQRALLFSGTIRENMRWRKLDATDEEIWQALKIAQADGFVAKMQDGLDSVVLQGGRNLSGGQKQRLTIARALIGQPQILIFDDSASALDYATESKLRLALRKNAKDSAVIIVSQRATAIRHADKILVLEEGKIADIGTHDELMTRCNVYSEICLSQQVAGGDTL